MSKNARFRSLPQKSSAAMSNRAPSSLFADLRMSCSPERGWSGGSIPTLWHNGIQLLCLLAHCGELMGIHLGSRLVHAQLYSCGHRYSGMADEGVAIHSVNKGHLGRHKSMFSDGEGSEPARCSLLL